MWNKIKLECGVFAAWTRVVLQINWVLSSRRVVFVKTIDFLSNFWAVIPGTFATSYHKDESLGRACTFNRARDVKKRYYPWA